MAVMVSRVRSMTLTRLDDHSNPVGDTIRLEPLAIEIIDDPALDEDSTPIQWMAQPFTVQLRWLFPRWGRGHIRSIHRAIGITHLDRARLRAKKRARARRYPR